MRKNQTLMYYFKCWISEKNAWELERLFNEPFGESGFTVYPGDVGYVRMVIRGTF